MYYGLATSILYIFALIGMLIAMLVIHRLIAEEKKKDRKAMRGQPNLKRFGNFQGSAWSLKYLNGRWSFNHFAYSRINRVYILLIGNVFINAPHLWNELRNMMLISTLFILYLVLLGPYLVRGKVDQIRQVILWFQIWNIPYLFIYIRMPSKNNFALTLGL